MHQHLCVDTLSFEYGIYVRSVAIQFVGKPSDGAFLAVKFIFNHFPDVYHGTIKKAEPFITYFQSKVPPSTLHTNKYEQSTPDRT